MKTSLPGLSLQIRDQRWGGGGLARKSQGEIKRFGGKNLAMGCERRCPRVRLM